MDKFTKKKSIYTVPGIYTTTTTTTTWYYCSTVSVYDLPQLFRVNGQAQLTPSCMFFVSQKFTQTNNMAAAEFGTRCSKSGSRYSIIRHTTVIKEWCVCSSHKTFRLTRRQPKGTTRAPEDAPVDLAMSHASRTESNVRSASFNIVDPVNQTIEKPTQTIILLLHTVYRRTRALGGGGYTFQLGYYAAN